MKDWVPDKDILGSPLRFEDLRKRDFIADLRCLLTRQEDVGQARQTEWWVNPPKRMAGKFWFGRPAFAAEAVASILRGTTKDESAE